MDIALVKAKWPIAVNTSINDMAILADKAKLYCFSSFNIRIYHKKRSEITPKPLLFIPIIGCRFNVFFKLSLNFFNLKTRFFYGIYHRGIIVIIQINF